MQYDHSLMFYKLHDFMINLVKTSRQHAANVIKMYKINQDIINEIKTRITTMTGLNSHGAIFNRFNYNVLKQIDAFIFYLNKIMEQEEKDISRLLIKPCEFEMIIRECLEDLFIIGNWTVLSSDVKLIYTIVRLENQSMIEYLYDKGFYYQCLSLWIRTLSAFFKDDRSIINPNGNEIIQSKYEIIKFVPMIFKKLLNTNININMNINMNSNRMKMATIIIESGSEISSQIQKILMTIKCYCDCDNDHDREIYHEKMIKSLLCFHSSMLTIIFKNCIINKDNNNSENDNNNMSNFSENIKDLENELVNSKLISMSNCENKSSCDQKT